MRRSTFKHTLWNFFFKVKLLSFFSLITGNALVRKRPCAVQTHRIAKPTRVSCLIKESLFWTFSNTCKVLPVQNLWDCKVPTIYTQTSIKFTVLAQRGTLIAGECVLIYKISLRAPIHIVRHTFSISDIHDREFPILLATKTEIWFVRTCKTIWAASLTDTNSSLRTCTWRTWRHTFSAWKIKASVTAQALIWVKSVASLTTFITCETFFWLKFKEISWRAWRNTWIT